MVSRYLLVSGAVGIAPINSHSNCTLLLLLLAPHLYRWNRTITSRFW